ncbi:cell wall-binding repeat-containing protein [Desulfosporosinus sp.]|uniref:cell wall-binding repeat-containing protein n=1 Tax=Desulfosporosinus sp. TaxID=157907 RepID=UPI002323B317|nr:cell wall-binding repeat-containing protein [Desulfosporosinus sp.]MDA8222499.1 cell wall-binding repeat-containing protein [Desulfitobacterium hafniense]
MICDEFAKDNPINTAILANASGYADALAASPLTKLYNAPVLLTEVDKLNPKTEAQLKKYNINKVVVVGGTAVVSKEIEIYLTSIGISVDRIGGYTMYDTAILITDRLPTTDCSAVFLVAGDEYCDALTVSSAAASYALPIFLVPKGANLTYADVPGLKERIQRFQSLNPLLCVYSTNRGISLNFTAGIKSSRIGADERFTKYGNNIAMNYTLNAYALKETVLFATGNGYVDALAGSALAGKLSAQIVFVGDDLSTTFKGDSRVIQQLTGIYKDMNKVIYLGGTVVVPDGAERKVVTW